MIIPTQNMADLHQSIIDNDTKVVGRASVGSTNNKIIKFIIRKADSAFYQVIKNRNPFRWCLKADYVWPVNRLITAVSTGSIVFRLTPLLHCSFTLSVELFRSTPATIGLPFFKELVNMLRIERKIIGLKIRAFIPVQPEPLHPLKNCINGFTG